MPMHPELRKKILANRIQAQKKAASVGAQVAKGPPLPSPPAQKRRPGY